MENASALAYTNPQIQSLEEANVLREPVLRSAIQALALAPGSRGLDVGCGIGLQTLLLAEAVGPAGRVTGLDISTELLAYAEERVKASPLARQVSFKSGDMRSLPFPDGSFDWVWSADCAGYPAGNLPGVSKEFVRVVRPGGTIAVLGWSSQQLLPGHELLEARLNATCSAYAPFLQGQPPELHFMRARCWFMDAGLTQVNAETFVGQVQAPLSSECRTALAALFEMLWGAAQPGASEADRLEYKRLCRAESPDCVLNLPEYYAFFTYSMFSGRVM